MPSSDFTSYLSVIMKKYLCAFCFFPTVCSLQLPDIRIYITGIKKSGAANHVYRNVYKAYFVVK
jgi:hypothetical protein